MNKTFYIFIAFVTVLIAEVNANPTGGSVAAGSATITNGSGSTTINQSSNAAIINWQSFSINHGETTKFIQPGVQSAALNRVLGGNASQINGSLLGNGQVYLINQNGIIVSSSGVVNVAGGFTASTRDISDPDFLKGNQHFIGHGQAGVLNRGQIQSALGNVVLIGKTVNNQGKLKATKGTVGLVAGDDVLLGQKNADGSIITVNPSPLATNTSAKTGVSNQGTISGVTAELKAANGNIYSAAINNGGSIRATTVSHRGGHIWLSSDSGSIVNSGTLNASATTSGGAGGGIVLKSKGTVSHTGAILAQGGNGGSGGNVDISGGNLVFKGTVDLTARGGITGNLLLDPTTLNVVTGGGVNLSGSTLDPSAVETALSTSNLTLNADDAITITNGITWGSANTLTLATNYGGTTLSILAPITGPNGGLTINVPGVITPGSNGSIDVGTFILQGGDWNQNANGGTLASFKASNDFELQNYSTFLRVAGGKGTSSSSPYLITDIYGLEGIDSPSGALLGTPTALHYFKQTQNIDASGAATWNPSEPGFTPIGNFFGTFYGSYDGGKNIITGLTTQLAYPLFATIGQGGTVQNLGISGGLFSYASLANQNSGTINNCFSTASVESNTSGALGGLVGSNTGLIEFCYSTGPVVNKSTGGAGGLLAYNSGTVISSYATGPVLGFLDVGGLAGSNSGTIQNCYSTSAVFGQAAVGGLVGENDKTIQSSFATGSVIGQNINRFDSDTGTFGTLGGLVGFNNYGATIASSFANGAVTGIKVGGLVGVNIGTIETSYATGDVEGLPGTPIPGVTYYAGGLVGSTTEPYSSLSGTVESSYSTGLIAGPTNIYVLGGLIANAPNSNGIVNNFWMNESINSKFFGIGSLASNVNATPETLANLSKQSTFPQGTGPQNWDFTNTWTTNGDTTPPLLRSLSFNLSGTAASGDPVDLIYNGSLTGTTTASSTGTYNFFVPANILTGALVTDLRTNANSSTFYSAGVLPSGGTSITGLKLAGNTLNIDGTGPASNNLLWTAIGTLSTGTYGINYGINSDQLTTANGAAISINAPYLANGNLTATNANLTTSSSAPLTVSDGVTLSGKAINLHGSLFSTGTVTLNAAPSTSPNITDSGSLNVGGFILENGYWNQNTTKLPAFNVSGDFELQNSSTFLRVAGGAGTSTSPYLIADVYGLQGIGSPSNLLIGTGTHVMYFDQIQNIDAGVTAKWNPTGVNQGFMAIADTVNGNAALPFYGNYNGEGYTISGLYINEPNLIGVGLFGIIEGGNLSNIGLINSSVNGLADVGGLVGTYASYSSSVTNCYNIGTVTGANTIGGLIGYNDTSLSNSYSNCNVTGQDEITGGLVGLNYASITNCYATGSVVGESGSTMTGGLVGYDAGTISNCYSACSVAGDTDTGGLVGRDFEGIVVSSYWVNDIGSNNQLSTFGLNNGTVDKYTSGETLAKLKLQSTYAPAGTGNGQWNFTLGTGIWGINGYSSSGLINGGLPYLQSQYPTVAKVTPTSQKLVYDGTTGTANLNQSAYTISLATGATAPAFSLAVNGSNVNVVNSGPVNTVMLDLPSNATYAVELNTTPAAVTYTPRPLTVTALSGQSIQYNTDTATGNMDLFASISNLVNGDSLSGFLGGYKQGETVQGEPYAITQGTLSNSNYAITFKSATFTISPIPVEVEGVNLTQTYGSKPNFSYTTLGLLPGDTLGGTATYVTNDTLSSGGYYNAGSYYYTPSLTGSNPNYNITTYESGYFNVNPAPLTVTATANQKVVYGTPTSTGNSSFTYSSKGLFSGDSLTGTLSGYTEGQTVASGSHPITEGTLANSNYTITYKGVNFTITPKPITVSGVNLATLNYGSTPIFADSITGLLSGDILGGTVSYSTTDKKSAGGYYNAGSYTYKPTLSGYNSNYLVTVTNVGTFTINPGILTYTANATTGTVGQPLPPLLGTVTGFLSSDTLGNATTGTLNFFSPALESSPAGVYAIYGDGLSAQNYIFVQAASNSTALTLKN